MNKLREIYDFGKLGIITERSKLPKYALAKLSYSFARADAENANKRTYSESILSREINRKSEELRKGKIAGMLNHPISGITELDKVAHVLTNVSYDRTTKLASAESFVLDTSKGRDFMVMVEAELAMGVSMRGFGNVKNGQVQSDWRLDTCDFVLHPSFTSDAMIDKSNIIESANNIFDEKGNKGGNMDKEMCGLSAEYITEMMQDCYKIYVKEENFKGSLEDFERELGVTLKAEILVAEGKCKDTESALNHLSKFGEVKRIPTIPRKKITPAEVFLEARMAGVDPKIYAEKINKNLEKSASELSPGEIVVALDEARQGGIDTGDEAERKKVLEIRRQQKTRKVLTEDERAVIVAMRTGSTAERVKEIWAFEHKKKAEEEKKSGKIDLLVKERMASGFGQEARPESRKISRRILEGE